MTRLYIEPDAEEELEEAATRYEDAVPGLGRQFLTELRQRVRNALEAPMRFRVFGESADVRCAGDDATRKAGATPQRIR